MTKAGVVVMGTLRSTGEMAPYSNPNHLLNQKCVALYTSDPQEVSEYSLESPAWSGHFYIFNSNLGILLSLNHVQVLVYVSKFLKRFFFCPASGP